MRDGDELEDAILGHLRLVAHSKRALLQVAVDISNDFPSQAALIITIITSMTRSADTLLGDTSVTTPPIPTRKDKP